MTPSPCPFCGKPRPDRAGEPCSSCGQGLPAVNLGPQLTIDADDAPPVRGVPPPPRPFAPVLLSNTREPGADSPLLDRCPECGARLAPKTSRCPACGRTLDERASAGDRLPPRRDYEAHRGPLLAVLSRVALFLSLPSWLALAAWFFAVAGVLALALSLTVILWAREDLEQIRQGNMDPDGQQPTESAQTFASGGAIIATIGLLLFTLGLLHRLLGEGP